MAEIDRHRRQPVPVQPTIRAEGEHPHRAPVVHAHAVRVEEDDIAGAARLRDALAGQQGRE
jgi:hypothetical protein